MFRFSKCIRETSRPTKLFADELEYHISSSGTYTNGIKSAFIHGRVGDTFWTDYGDDREFDPELARAIVKNEPLDDFEEKYGCDLSSLTVLFLKNNLSYELTNDGTPHQCSCDTSCEKRVPSCKSGCQEIAVLSQQERDWREYYRRRYTDIRPYYTDYVEYD